MTTSAEEGGAAQRPGWLPSAERQGENPHHSVAFARAYEKTATRIMAPISHAALQRIGAVGPGTRLLDIAAGTGALAIPAAHTGAAVTAIDNAPGMIEALTERLAPFPAADARRMDGQSLEFEDASFDAALSVMGVSMFPDWQRGLAEQVRVVRPGGKAVLATWRTLPGGGPFVIMAQALHAIFPDRPPPPAPPGFVALADPGRLRQAMDEAGLVDIEVEEIEAVWEGPAGPAYLNELSDLHPFMGPYAALDATMRATLDEAILKALEWHVVGERVVLRTSALIATGTRPI